MKSSAFTLEYTNSLFIFTGVCFSGPAKSQQRCRHEHILNAVQCFVVDRKWVIFLLFRSSAFSEI